MVSVVREVVRSIPDLQAMLKELILQNMKTVQNDVENPEQLKKEIQRKQKQLALLTDDVQLEDDDVLTRKCNKIKADIRALTCASSRFRRSSRWTNPALMPSPPNSPRRFLDQPTRWVSQILFRPIGCSNCSSAGCRLIWRHWRSRSTLVSTDRQCVAAWLVGPRFAICIQTANRGPP